VRACQKKTRNVKKNITTAKDDIARPLGGRGRRSIGTPQPDEGRLPAHYKKLSAPRLKARDSRADWLKP
jgi:hypothetical protein